MAVVINGSGTITGVTSQDELNVDSNTLVVDSTNDTVGIGTSSPERDLDIKGKTGDPVHLKLEGDPADYGRIMFDDGTTDNIGEIRYHFGDDDMRFRTNSAERMRIDSSGNLLVSKTATDTYSNTVGHELQSNGMLAVTRDGNKPLILNRLTSSGDIASFRKNGTQAGKMYIDGDAIELIGTSNYCRVGAGGNAGLSFYSGLTTALPWNGSTRSLTDDAMNLGLGAHRFNDIYATNTSIQTSDQNEKQQIASLTDTEMNVAKRLSALFKTFKWNSSVEEKGDNARTHSGIIAQDMQQAFTDEGLDAGNYAMFISDTWWEKEISVDAVEEETDEEGNVITEGQDAYTYMDSKYEATEGYTERTRLGVRYPELFAFINAYNDQRFADLETRIEALENA